MVDTDELINTTECGLVFKPNQITTGNQQNWSNWTFCHQYNAKKHDILRLVSSYQLNVQFFYSITIYILHYNPQHVSSSTLLILRRTSCIITASGIVILCTRPYSIPLESRLSPLSTGILYGHVQRMTIPEAVIIQLVLLRISKVLLETCCGL